MNNFPEFLHKNSLKKFISTNPKNFIFTNPITSKKIFPSFFEKHNFFQTAFKNPIFYIEIF